MTIPAAPKSQLAALPPVDRVLAANDALALIAQHGREPVTSAVRDAIADLRHALLAGKSVDMSIAAVIAVTAQILAAAATPSLRPVYNLTGTVLHTNLGRAALCPEALEAVMTVASGASNLEYDLEAGNRGERDDHVATEIAEITGAEAALLVNNNAAAVMLVLNTLGLGQGVAVSRGELVEIGGSFRIPDIMARSGATLVEVGTTNRTHVKDFAAALDDGAAMIMKVHTSNYIIEGFTADVPETGLAELARKHSVPFINDLGSGTLVNLERFGLPHEPTPMDALAAGADVVTFSGDKMLGGPQAGLIVGRRDLIEKIARNPMKRALRCDKMTIAALAATLRLYRDPDRLAERLPTLRWLTRPQDEIHRTAEAVGTALTAALGPQAEIEVVACESQIGSGALPTRTVPSAGIAISQPGVSKSSGTWLTNMATAFRHLPCPVIGRIHDDRFLIDLRCLDDHTAFIEQFDALDFATMSAAS